MEFQWKTGKIIPSPPLPLSLCLLCSVECWGRRAQGKDQLVRENLRKEGDLVSFPALCFPQ